MPVTRDSSVEVVLDRNVDMGAIPSVPANRTLSLDMSQAEFFRPSGLVGLACLAKDASRLQVTWPSSQDTRNYLGRMNVDTVLQSIEPGVSGLGSVRHHDAPLCELAFFTGKFEIEKLCDLVRRQLVASRVNPEIQWIVESGAWEICDNATTHSNWEAGGVLAAQLYGKQEQIEFAVADGGVGILATLTDEYPDLKDDAEAIVRASEYGATRFGVNRRGAGLSDTIEAVTQTGGSVTVRSGSAQVVFDGKRQSIVFNSEPWRGTLVKVVVQLPQD